MSDPTTPTSALALPDEVMTRREFADGLSHLRIRSGTSFRGLAQQTAIPATTISGWMNGKHLPYMRQIPILRSLLAALGSDEATAEAWVEALLRVRQTTVPRQETERAPYRGLERFDVDDARFFVGRDELVGDIVRRIDAMRPLTDEPRLIVVIGVSGAGKSSLLRAGVAASIEAHGEGHGPRVALFTPGEHPAEAFAAAMSATDDRAVGTVIVDQFEEVFTLTPAAERAEFLRALSDAATGPDGIPTVVALRADYFADLAEYGVFAAALQHRQVLVTALDRAQLREVIVEPARRAGVSVDPGLVEMLISDYSPRSGVDGARDAGALPFLSHALLETWRMSGREGLSIAGYTAAGRLDGAIEQTAEAAFGKLSDHQKQMARTVLLRLVNIDDDGAATRRRATIEELASATGDELTLVDGVVDQFVSDRLLTVDEATLELSHEVLLTAWSRLSDWVTDDRDALMMARQIRDAARVWVSADHEPAALLSAGRLAAFTSVESSNAVAAQLGPVEREFLAKSRESVQRREHLSRRRRRVLVGLTAVSITLSVLASTAAVVAVRARADAEDERNAALSRKVALQAAELSVTDPALAAQLAMAAYDLSPTSEARSAVLDATSVPVPERFLGDAGTVALASSGDRQVLAVSNAVDGAIQLFRSSPGAIARAESVSPPGEVAELFALAISPDGKWLAAGGVREGVALWSLGENGAELVEGALGSFPGAVQTLSFNADSSELAAGTLGPIRRWSIATGGALTELAPIESSDEVLTKSLAYSPDGSRLAFGGSDGTIRIFDVSGAEPTELTSAPSAEDEVHSIAFSPDGGTLAAGFRSAAVRVWTLADDGLSPAEGPTTEFGTWVNAVAFSADGSMLTAGSSDSSVQVWQVKGWEPARTFHHPGPVTGLVFVDHDRRLVASSTDGAVRAWPLEGTPLAGAHDNIFNVSFTADGSTMAVFPGSKDGTVQLWDTASLRAPVPLDLGIAVPETAGRAAGSGALSPDGRSLIAGTAEGPSQAWAVDDPRSPAPVAEPLAGPTALVEMVAISTDSRFAAIGSDDATVHLWDISDPAAPTALPTLTDATNQILGLAFNSDSTLLAGASADTFVYLWDFHDPSAPKLLATLEGFTSYAQAVAFSDDGRLLAAGGADKSVLVWDVADPAAPVALGEAITGPQGYVYAVDFQPGTRVLTGGVTDGTVWMWDLDDPDSPVALATLTSPDAAIFAAGFSPDGATIAGAGSDRVVFLWAADPEVAAASLCDLVGDDITETEWELYLGDEPYTPPCRGDS